MTRRYDDYLRDIADSVDKISEFVKGFTFEKFVEDEKTTYAVIRAFEIIGEAAKNIPAETRLRYPMIDWKKMTGIRDKFVHEYFGIDLKIVWQTIQEDVPNLKKQIDGIVRDLEN